MRPRDAGFGRQTRGAAHLVPHQELSGAGAQERPIEVCAQSPLGGYVAESAAPDVCGWSNMCRKRISLTLSSEISVGSTDTLFD